MLFTQGIRKRLEVTKNALFSMCREREREREEEEGRASSGQVSSGQKVQ